jgi:hypothetical protein
MNNLKLHMVIIGCKPKGRHTEQHDVYFGIAETIQNLVPQLKSFWPEVADNMHLDVFRQITQVDGYMVTVVEKAASITNEVQLFFLNLGGYKENEMEEFHYKMVVAAKDKGEAIKKAKETAFYKHTRFKGANSHIDDKYGVDVDDIYAIEDILPNELTTQYTIQLEKATELKEDELYLGYFKLSKIEKGNFVSE